MKVNMTQQKPKTAMMAAFLPLQPTLMRWCKSAAYTSQVTRDQTSFGSQLHQEPHAELAQMEPVIIPAVRRGKPNLKEK